MAKKLAVLSVITGVALILGLASATPAAAQAFGTIRGRVLDDKGKPLQEADVTITNLSDPMVQPQQVQSDQLGIFKIDKLKFGNYEVTVKKGTLRGRAKDQVRVQAGSIAELGDLKLHQGTPEELKVVTSADVAKVAAENAEKKKVNDDLLAADAAMSAGKVDDAIAGMNSVIAARPTCGPCYVKLGDAYVKKENQGEAEKAYLKAIELGPEKEVAGAYASLAHIYNAEHKLDEAAKMSTKANELLDAAGGGNASTAYNQGVILWNQGDKMTEAEAQFRKAVKLDPKMADAQYFLGMTLVNQNKLTEAKAPFLEYLKLDPKGKYATDVKDMLAAIK